MVRIAGLAMMVLALLACVQAAPAAESKAALVIGNGAYQTLPALNNPPNDAADMASDAADRVSNVASRVQKQVTDYVSSHNASDMLEDLNSYVKRYPTQAIVAAAAVGFIAAALLRRR